MVISTVGFLGMYCFEDGVPTRGAILVTSMDTKPLEFRITAPVRPEPLQTTLFGELLKEHIAVDLTGLPLLNAVDNKPDLILVCDDLLLGINSKQEIPTIRMMRTDEPVSNRRSQAHTLNPPDSSRQSAKIYTSEKFAERLQALAEQLQVVFSQRDLMEPFERLERACNYIHEKKMGG